MEDRRVESVTLRCGTLRRDITGYASVIIVFGNYCFYCFIVS